MPGGQAEGPERRWGQPTGLIPGSRARPGCACRRAGISRALPTSSLSQGSPDGRSGDLALWLPQPRGFPHPDGPRGQRELSSFPCGEAAPALSWLALSSSSSREMPSRAAIPFPAPSVPQKPKHRPGFRVSPGSSAEQSNLRGSRGSRVPRLGPWLGQDGAEGGIPCCYLWKGLKPSWLRRPRLGARLA